uniref:Uncharacterized protein n=1 Tax=Mustela putorius furo TaxID=9669 RepID=M3Y195_MUSPF
MVCGAVAAQAWLVARGLSPVSAPLLLAVFAVALLCSPPVAVATGGTSSDQRETAMAAQAPSLSSSKHPASAETTPAPAPGKLFGILKADFTIPALTDPEDLKDQFLREVRLQTTSDFDQSGDLMQGNTVGPNIPRAKALEN